MTAKARDNVQLSHLTPKSKTRVSHNGDGPAARSRLLHWPKPDPPAQLGLFSENAIDLAALRRELADLAESHRARNTHRAYGADWRNFQNFCRDTGRDPLPADPQTVMFYLAYEAKLGRAASTITRRLSAINSEHKASGFSSPCTPDVGLVLHDIRRKYGTKAHPKASISPSELRRMIERTTKTVAGIRDSAILALGFASGARREEISALNVGDAIQRPGGLILAILRSKGDQQAQGREIGIHWGRRSATCPVRRLKSWLKVRGHQAGPLFTRVVQNSVTQQRLSGEAIARVVKRAARRAGLEPSQYAGHSLRSGCATAAAEIGTDVLAIASRLGHKSARTTERYIRQGRLFSVNPLRGVL